MAETGILNSGEITRKEFDAALKLYPSLIQKISASKAAKSAGKTSLEDLDFFRFETAPAKYQSAGKKPIILERNDVLRLVEWKLKHGTFRPKLLALVESNSETDLRAAIEAGLVSYENHEGKVAKAIKELTALKGMGPATASLILSVHDPAKTIFFSDEAFLWICCGGKNAPIKYNAKEYEELVTRSRELIKRLGVDAIEVEKVAFVLMRGTTPESSKSSVRALEKEEQSVSSKRKASTMDSEIGVAPDTSKVEEGFDEGASLVKDNGKKRRRTVKPEEPTAASKRPKRGVVS